MLHVRGKVDGLRRRVEGKHILTVEGLAASWGDPNELHPNGVDYDDAQAKATLLDLADLAGKADLVVAFAPRASMGTAIEMWEGFRAGKPLVTISPMAANWVVRHLSDVVLPDLDSFRAWVAGGGLARLLSGE